MADTLLIQHLDGADHALVATVKGVVIGGSHQLDACLLHRVGIFIRRIERQMVLGIASGLTGQRGLQIANNIVGLIQKALYMGEHAVKIVCTIGLLGGLQHRRFDHNIAQERDFHLNYPLSVFICNSITLSTKYCKIRKLCK